MTRKELIVQKAIELFARDGFEATSIQKLAEASGVAQGLLYRHFKNKHDLLLHLVEMGLTQIAATLQPYHNPDLSFKEAFTQHIRSCCRLMQSEFMLWKVLHMTRQNATLMNTLSISADPAKLIVKPIRDKLRREGCRHPDMHAWMIFSLIDGVTSLYLVHPDQYPLRKMEKFIIEKISDYVC
jgi:AcrR family transcriptional regulator